MGYRAPQAALWALVALLLVGGLAALPGAWAASTPTYTLTGWVEQPGTFAPVPAGVTVDLISQATHATYTATTQSSGGVPSGQFTFTAANTGGSLAPGWWTVTVPPQARLHLVGCNPCAILPRSLTATATLVNTTALTTAKYPITISNVQALTYNTTIFGNATNGATPAVNASVQLLAGQYASMVLANATTNRTGAFNFTAPWGTWVLRTTLPSSPSRFDFQQVIVAGTRMTVNPAISAYLTYGHVNQASAPAAHVPNGGNATVVDLTNYNLYSYSVPQGGFYAIGSYPFNFSGATAQQFDVVLSLVGYAPAWYPLNVSPANPTGTGNPHDVLAAAEPTPPAYYNTSLLYGPGFNNLSVYTNASLQGGAVFPDLPNASLGQLWGQLALDTSHNLTFSSGNLATIYSWANRQGPFFPAFQAGTTVNSVPLYANTTYAFTPTSTCAGGCGLSSAATLGFAWQAKYNTTTHVGTALKNYTLMFNFKHPTHAQAYNYTVQLPPGYVLSAGTQQPAGATLVPAGPGGTWTKFIVVSKPYSSPSTLGTFPIVKYGNISANVNISVSNFAFSVKNVLNSTRGNYTVIVGSGENVTFSGVNSTFPPGTNGTLYKWTYGDSSPVYTSSMPTAYHTYAAFGKYLGSLTVTSSGNYKSTTNFTVYAGNLAPVAVISTNATKILNANGENYTLINWSTTLHFNASLSDSTLYPSAPVDGVISIANWSITSHGFTAPPANYTAGQRAYFGTNDTYRFTGAGYYLTGTTIKGVAVAFTGWQYNVSVTVWDGGGHRANASMVVLVRDTQKPVPVVTVLDSKGHTVSASGLIEAANQTAEVQLAAANSTDPNNGSIVWYNWTIKNTGNSSVNVHNNQSALAGFKIPPKPMYWLAPQAKAYTVNLTVTDRAGNTAYKTATVPINPNASLRPVLSVGNVTAPSTMTDGSTYTVWVNVTNTIGQNSTAEGVAVLFYLLPPSGSGSPIAIGGSPGSVKFFNYTSNTTTNATPFATGSASLKWNHTVRAEISFTPARQGSWSLWVNATATNEFPQSYKSGANTAHVAVQLNANPLTTYEEIAAIAAVAVLVIVAVYFLVYRPRMKGGATTSTTSGKRGLERGGGKDEDEEDEEEEP